MRRSLTAIGYQLSAISRRRQDGKTASRRAEVRGDVNCCESDARHSSRHPVTLPSRTDFRLPTSDFRGGDMTEVNTRPKLHNAMWPGLVGKGGDAEPPIA